MVATGYAGPLCMNRPEGLSTTSSISPPYPTQCFFDVVLVPLATWFYIVAFAAFFLSSRLYNLRQRDPPTRYKTLRSRYFAYGIYLFFIAALLIMESVEVGRLRAANLGTGLLGFVYVGVVGAAVLQLMGGFGGEAWWWWIPTTGFWIFCAVVSGVKLAALKMFQTPELDRANTAYPIADQVTDLVVLVVFYCLLVVAEPAMIAWRWSCETRPRGGSGRAFQLPWHKRQELPPFEPNQPVDEWTRHV